MVSQGRIRNFDWITNPDQRVARMVDEIDENNRSNVDTQMCDKIVDFLDENDIIRDTQHGFRRGRSCLTNLLEFFDRAPESFDKGRQLDVSYLAFSKAFDKVPHKRLCLQLKWHGINTRILHWIENWLSGRQQRVLLNGTKSGWSDVLSGVPQGSVLGPLLFLIFINSIEDDVNSTVLKFADDLKVFRIIEGNMIRKFFKQI